MSTKERKKLIIDCDAGTDDAYAIFMALSQNHVEVLAVTCVEGNTTLANVSKNVLRILKVCSRLDIPVFSGCNASLLGKKSPGSGYHGWDGLGDVPDPDAPGQDQIQSKHAVTALLEIVNKNQGEITLVAIGPLTNIAMAIRLDPTFGTKLKNCYVMGGNIEAKGNISLTGEFNVHSDPEAAYIVFHELQITIHLFPMEMCWKHALTWEWYDKLDEIDSIKLKTLKNWMKITTENSKAIGTSKFWVYDQVAMAAATNHDIIEESKLLYATVELTGTHTRGQVVWDWNNVTEKKPNICLVTKINANFFQNLMILSC